MTVISCRAKIVLITKIVLNQSSERTRSHKDNQSISIFQHDSKLRLYKNYKTADSALIVSTQFCHATDVVFSDDSIFHLFTEFLYSIIWL